mgnify:CR=1 FL=1
MARRVYAIDAMGAIEGRRARADLVVVDRDHAIHVFIAQFERLLADGLDRGAVRK